MPYTTIDQILAALQKIIETSEKTGDRVGYFAALYYKVTAKVKEGIDKNEFENGPRSATRRSSLLVLQQLLLGMNAHINLDLGIAAVETTGTGQLADIQKDFDAINTIIGSLTFEVIHEIDRISPLLSLIGLHANNSNSLLIQFSVTNARDGAWAFAEDLSQKKGEPYDAAIKARDTAIAKLAGTLVKSTGLMRVTLWVVHFFEWRNPKKIIHVLHEYKKKFLTT